jgi:hypothetical protein
MISMRARAPVLVASWLAAAFLAAPAVGAPAGRAESLARLRAAAEVQKRHVPALMGIRGVVATGTALGADGEPEIRVFTSERGVRGLPRELEGVRVRSRVSGRFYARLGPTCEASGDSVCEPFERWPRPVPIGVSIGHPAITAGTIGARVTDGTQVFALSNNHVLANSNGAQLGDASLQPGPFDGGSEGLGDHLGTLHDFEPIVFCQVILFPFVSCPVVNAFDAALASSTEADLGFATPTGEFGSLVGYGAPNPQLHPAYGDPAVIGDETLADLLQESVRKHGRTTGSTTGTIGTIGVTVDVCYDELCSLVARFVDQLFVPHTAGAFSAGGDSGSLVVSDDGFHHPVGLLFAGSETDTIVSRIDLVLDRFGVTIDDGGATGPFADAAVQSLDTPPWALIGQATTVPVTVRNVGNQPLGSFDVVFDDLTEATSATFAAPALDPGEQAQLDFSWTPTAFGPHALSATLQLGDDDPGNDQLVAQVDALFSAPGVSLERWSGTARTDAWTQVGLARDYGDDMVPICTPLYDVNGLGPLMARVRNAEGASFEVGLGRPWFLAFPGEETTVEVHCIVLRRGVYDVPGFKLEAVRLEGFSGKDDAFSWAGTARSYAQSYTQPVVLGQVVSSGGGLPGDTSVWSTFWARGATSLDPPSAAALFVGRHTAEDPNPRPPETLVYMVIEAGSGTIEGAAYEAGLGPETVRGVGDAPPYAYALTSFPATATSAIASPAGMDGLEGGWPILYGAGAVAYDALGLAIEEDWYWDPERSHTTEQVAYLVFGARPRRRCGIGFELALLVPLLAQLRRLRRT